jgi:transcriptional regulator with XRE-family HTH domain
MLCWLACRLLMSGTWHANYPRPLKRVNLSRSLLSLRRTLPFLVTLAGVEPGRKHVLIVEDWAEIRRLRRSEGVSISEIARVLGCSRNTVKAALASEGPPRYERAPAGSLVDGYEPRIRELLAGVSADAGDGDRRTCRVAVFDPHVEWPGEGVASGVSAAGSGWSDLLCRRGGRAV